MSPIDRIMHGAMQAHQAGRLDAAVQGYRLALSMLPDHPVILSQCGVAELQRGHMAEAQQLFEASLAREPAQADVLSNLAHVLNQRGEHRRAVEVCDRSLALLRPNPDALTNQGEALRALGQADDALARFDAALAARPDRPDYRYNRANALLDLGRLDEAITEFRAALAQAPQVQQIRINLAAAHIRNHQLQQAIELLEEARQIDPSDPLVWMNLGAALDAERRSGQAEACFRRVIELTPDDALGHANLAQVLDGTGQHAEAIAHYTRALALNPSLRECIGGRLMARRHIGDQTGQAAETELLHQALAAGHPAVTPFNAIALLDDPQAVTAAVTNHVRLRLAAAHRGMPAADSAARPPDGKVRVGYFSADFGEHPVTYLLLPVLQAHDRQAVEVHAFLTHRQPPSAALRAVQAAVERFHDVTTLSATEVRQLARAEGIDIAVDLGGHTLNNRPDLFIGRLAPVQVSYLGFPGPSGIPAMDYLLADDALIPADLRHHYPEHVAYLDSYQANAAAPSPPAPAAVMRRSDHGLPEDAFVFCCFSNSYKFSPATLGMWAQILAATPASVLWLYADNMASRENLTRHFADQGIAADRLRFAGRVARDDYFSRMALADLYLDTTPYSAGTTASDALRAGLPILTMTGTTFSARMCTSVLRSAGLGELAVGDPQAYVARAVQLCTDRDMLLGIRSQVLEARGSKLFDPAGTARQLESLFRQMHRLRCSGGPLTDLRAG